MRLSPLFEHVLNAIGRIIFSVIVRMNMHSNITQLRAIGTHWRIILSSLYFGLILYSYCVLIIILIWCAFLPTGWDLDGLNLADWHYSRATQPDADQTSLRPKGKAGQRFFFFPQAATRPKKLTPVVDGKRHSNRRPTCVKTCPSCIHFVTGTHSRFIWVISKISLHRTHKIFHE